MSELSQAIQDILAEKAFRASREHDLRQHDDISTEYSLSEAASCYSRQACYRHWVGAAEYQADTVQATDWPKYWPKDAWEPTSPRQDLVRAAELLIREIERIDRRIDPDLDAQGFMISSDISREANKVPSSLAQAQVGAPKAEQLLKHSAPKSAMLTRHTPQK